MIELGKMDEEIFVLVLSDPHTCCRNFKPIAVFGRDRVWCETINQQTAFKVRCCHRPPKLPPLRAAQRKRRKRSVEDRPLKVVSGQQQHPNLYIFFVLFFFWFYTLG